MPVITSTLLLLKRPIDIVVEAGASGLKEKFVAIRATSNIKLIHQKLSATQKVKTIWNVDRAISINSFYYAAKIKNKDGVGQTISNLDDLPSNAIVISGVVGQGKSILLRYLLGKEMKSGLRVPLMVELRRTPPEGLVAYLREAFADLMGFHAFPKLFDLFAAEGKLSILLDGFDEIDPERISEITTAIEKLASKFPSARLIVTSRPNSGLENSPLLEIVHLAQLGETDFTGFFHKILPRDKELADRITKALLSSPQNVKTLAATPLLATLLTIVYRAHQKIPSDFSEFYEELFQILLVRHDRSKSGYERRRKTSLTDREIQQVFEAFCYKVKAEGQGTLSRNKASELASGCISAQELVCSEDSFLTDIIKVTCLLQEEGGTIEFLHESVKEFFAARYIAARPYEVAKRFYALTLKSEKWRSWDQVLKFLSQIDRYKANQLFFIPAIRETLTYFDSLEKVGPISSLRERISDVVVVHQSTKKNDGTPELPRFSVAYRKVQPYYRWSAVISNVYGRFFGVGNPGEDWRRHFDGATHGQYMDYSEIAARNGTTEKLNTVLQAAIADLHAELAQLEVGVAVQDASAEFMGL